MARAPFVRTNRGPAWIASLVIALLAPVAGVVTPGGTPAAPAKNPAALDDEEKEPRLSPRDEKVKKLLDYLEGEYAKKTTSPYWVTRAMGVISMAKSPRGTATAKLFDVLEKDRHEVVRLLAWQALLARMPEMDPRSFVRFSQLTLPMAEKDMFRGGLRVPLVEVMACNAPNPRWKKVFEKLLTDCNSWEPDDVPVLDALGACLASWRSPALVDALIKLLTQTDAALRAERVLVRAGSPVRTTLSTLPASIFDPLATNRAHPSWSDMWNTTQREHQKWWSGEKPKWKETVKPEGPVWKDLKPRYVAAPFALDAIDPDDKLWYRDLELGKAELQQMEVQIVLDVTESMGDVLEWLKHDLARVMQAFQMLAREPATVGITFYRDEGDPWVVKQLPLTNRLKTLEPDVEAMDAMGGGDIPEAVLPALKEATTKNKWTKRTQLASKIIILVGDAPPHSKDMPEILVECKKCVERGMRIYAAKVTTERGRNDLSDFDEIAKTSGGATVEVEFRRPIRMRFVMPSGADIPYKTIDRPETQLVIPEPLSDDAPGEKIMTLVIADTISKEYRDRVAPLARTLLAFTAKPSKPEKRLGFPANTPPLERGRFKPQ